MLNRDGLAGEADHPFHKIQGRIVCRAEHHDIAPAWFVMSHTLHQAKIPRLQRWRHAVAIHDVWLDNELNYEKDTCADNQQPQEGLDTAFCHSIITIGLPLRTSPIR